MLNTISSVDFETENILSDQNSQYCPFHNKTSMISSNKTIKETFSFVKVSKTNTLSESFDLQSLPIVPSHLVWFMH